VILSPHVQRRVFIAALLAAVAGATTAQPMTGRVVEVIDGDTVTVLLPSRSQLKVRLAGIDAPEKRQAFGQRAKQQLATLVFDKRVTVVGHKYDRYRRLVAKLIVDGRDANFDMVAAGYAWHYKRYELEQLLEDRLAYAWAESRARAERRGLWADSAPVPPWEFRHH
jgi:endonuclease YncB( thermonuclease family)